MADKEDLQEEENKNENDEITRKLKAVQSIRCKKCRYEVLHDAWGR